MNFKFSFEEFNNSNIPDPNLLRVMASGDQNFYDAINDIVDNCNDAKSTSIKIQIDKLGIKVGNRIFVVDNGEGMNFEVASNLLTLAKSNKSDSSMSGKFGVGLKNASLSIGNIVTVITKAKNSKLIVTHLNIEELKNVGWNTVCNYVEELDQIKSEFFKCFWNENAISKDNGTIVIIENLYHEKLPKTIETLEKHLLEKLGKIFRKHIEKNTIINVNDKKVEAVNPFKNSKLLESIDLNSKNGIFNLNFYELDESGELDTQGLYIYRSNRLIDEPSWHGIRKPHNGLNKLRVEIIFQATEGLDKDFGISFTKTKIKFTENVHDLLKEYIGKWSKYIQSKYTKENYNKKANEEFLQQKTLELKKTAGMSLLKKIISKEKRNPKVNIFDKDKKETQNPDSRTRNPKVTQNVFNDAPHSMKFVALGESANLFETDWIDGGIAEIQINENHPMYKYFSSKLNESDFIDILYCFARSFLNFEINDDGSKEFKKAQAERNTMLQEFSNNLKVIFKEKLLNNDSI